MDKTIFMQKAATGVFTQQEQEEIAHALDINTILVQAQQQPAVSVDWGKVVASIDWKALGASVNTQVLAGAFDWKAILAAILPAIFAAIPGLSAFAPIINLIFSIFKIPVNPLPTPGPVPIPGGGFIVPTPVP